MGNRAVITTADKEIGIYLHWNGGRDSVEAFLTYCKIRGYRCPENDCYGWARLCQVIGNFFGGEYSVGIDVYKKLDIDNGDNGTYIIKDWQIIGKEFEPLEARDEENFKEMLRVINKSQPVTEQFDKETMEREINNYLVSTITTRQIKAIHAIINELGFTEYRYKQILKYLFEVNTCKELTEKQASVLIEMLNKMKG